MAGLRVPRNQNGFGIIEVLISLGVLMVIAAVVMSQLTDQRKAATQLSETSNCNEMLSSYFQLIKNLDNNLTIRTVIHGSNPLGASGASAGDPLCTFPSQASCDSTANPLYRTSPGGSVVVTSAKYDVALSQNIRGAAVWAANLYNAHRPAICSTGIVFKENGPFGSNEKPLLNLGEYFPSLAGVPLTTKQVVLKIEQAGKACDGSPTLARLQENPEFEVSITVNLGKPNINSGDFTCSQTQTRRFAFEGIRPETPSMPSPLVITNGLGQVIGANECSCKQPSGAACPERNTIRVQVPFPIAGSLICRQDGTAFSGGNLQDKYCGELAQVSVAGLQISGYPQIKFGVPGTVELLWTVNDSGDNPNQIGVRAINMIGEASPEATSPFFRVRLPTCDPMRPCGSTIDTCGGNSCVPQTAIPPCPPVCVPSCNPLRPCGSTLDTCGGFTCPPQSAIPPCVSGCVPTCDAGRPCGSTVDSCGGNTCAAQTAIPPCPVVCGANDTPCSVNSDCCSNFCSGIGLCKTCVVSGSICASTSVFGQCAMTALDGSSCINFCCSRSYTTSVGAPFNCGPTCQCTITSAYCQ